jgi:DNA-directed RNA polymerase subunit alpha
VISTLRRILLQELGGLGLTDLFLEAPTHAAHEFVALGGIQETLPEIVDNLRTVSFKALSANVPTLMDVAQQTSLNSTNERALVHLNKTGMGRITAGDLQLPTTVDVADPHHPIATLVSPHACLRFSASLGYGKNYVSCVHQVRPSNALVPELSLRDASIVIEPTFAPVRRVNYLIKQEDTYEFALLEIWTDGTIHPSHALGEASCLAKHMFQPFL